MRPIDLIIVLKSERILQLLSNGQIYRSYKIDLGRDPIGHKMIEGDNKTPEGIYYIEDKNPNSIFHLNLGISYPNEDDKARAESIGRSAGSLIKIHGQPNDASRIQDYPRKDWTRGCIALSNEDMEEVYELIEIGTRIDLRP